MPNATVEAPAAPGERPVARPPNYQVGFQQRAGQSVALGLFGSLMSLGGCFCCVLPIASIAMGWAGYTRGRDELRDIDNGYIGADTRGLATTGMILGLVSMGLGGLTFLLSVAAAIFRAYSAQRGGYY